MGPAGRALHASSLTLPGRAGGARRFGRFDTLAPELARLVASSTGSPSGPSRPGRCATARGCRPATRRGRATSWSATTASCFEVVADTADGRGVELRGVEQPLTLYVAKGQIGREFARLVGGAAVSRPGVRISGGELRGRLLGVPAETRPSGGRVRESLFSIWGERVRGCRFLDLFAGSGVVGSRRRAAAPASVVLVEAEPRALRTLAANLRRMAADRVAVRPGRLPAELHKMAASGGEPFDLVFADPPYRYPAYPALLAAARAAARPRRRGGGGAREPGELGRRGGGGWCGSTTAATAGAPSASIVRSGESS